MKEKIINEIERTIGSESLIEFLLSSDFFTAPASGEYHLSVDGGLAQHSWNVYEALCGIVKKYVPDTPKRSVVVCGLLHDICKANFYKKDFRNKKNEFGVWEKVPYFAIDDQDPLGHGEKSVIILSRFIPLNQDEAWAIRWHMGAWDAETFMQKKTCNAAIQKCALLRALILADQVATFFIEHDTPNQKEK